MDLEGGKLDVRRRPDPGRWGPLVVVVGLLTLALVHLIENHGYGFTADTKIGKFELLPPHPAATPPASAR